MYQIEKFKSKGLFGQRTPVDVANEWLILKGNTIRVVATSPIFDDDGNLLELLITYEIDKLEENVKKKSMFNFLGSKEKEIAKTKEITTKKVKEVKEVIIEEVDVELKEESSEEIANDISINNDDSNKSSDSSI